jgi:hypothetical protein
LSKTRQAQPPRGLRQSIPDGQVQVDNSRVAINLSSSTAALRSKRFMRMCWITRSCKSRATSHTQE